MIRIPVTPVVRDADYLADSGVHASPLAAPNDATTRYNEEVVVVETAYPFTQSGDDSLETSTTSRASWSPATRRRPLARSGTSVTSRRSCGLRQTGVVSASSTGRHLDGGFRQPLGSDGSFLRERVGGLSALQLLDTAPQAQNQAPAHKLTYPRIPNCRLK